MVLIKEKDPDVSFNARNTELTGQLTIVCIFNNMMWIFFKKKKNSIPGHRIFYVKMVMKELSN